MASKVRTLVKNVMIMAAAEAPCFINGSLIPFVSFVGIGGNTFVNTRAYFVHRWTRQTFVEASTSTFTR